MHSSSLVVIMPFSGVCHGNLVFPSSALPLTLVSHGVPSVSLSLSSSPRTPTSPPLLSSISPLYLLSLSFSSLGVHTDSWRSHLPPQAAPPDSQRHQAVQHMPEQQRTVQTHRLRSERVATELPGILRDLRGNLLLYVRILTAQPFLYL